jgi:hypothetical protein
MVVRRGRGRATSTHHCRRGHHQRRLPERLRTPIASTYIYLIGMNLLLPVAGMAQIAAGKLGGGAHGG